MAAHQHALALARELDQLVGQLGRGGERLLDERVLAGAAGSGAKVEVGEHRRRDHDRVELGVVEQVVDVAWSPSTLG